MQAGVYVRRTSSSGLSEQPWAEKNLDVLLSPAMLTGAGAESPATVSMEKVEASDEEQGDRKKWNKQVQFVLTCIGFAVGLGNVWRFPYLAFRNGGGAFLVPYFLMLLMVGIPIYFFEAAFGQFGSLGPTKIWKVVPLLKGIGWGTVVIPGMIALFYNVVTSYCMFFLFASMTSRLPWDSCNNTWNTDNCVHMNNLKNATNTKNMSQIKTPSEEFFFRHVLRMTEGIGHTGDVVWPLALCLLLCWIIVFLVLIRGIQSLGKVVYFTSTFPYLMMGVMLIRGATLPGAVDGIIYYVRPDFSKLGDSRVWSDAATQIFYSLATCLGGVIAMASHNNFKNNCLRDALVVPVINGVTSIWAGFIVFSVLGFMAHLKGVDINDVATSGPGLVFVVYPEALSAMPVPVLWSILFFFMLLILAFSTQFSLMETLFITLTDEYPQLGSSYRSSIIFRGLCCVGFFLLSMPMVTQAGFYWFHLMDSFTLGFPLLIVGFCEMAAIMWIYGYNRFAEDVEMMIGKKPNWYFKITWNFVTPVCLIVLIVSKAIATTRLKLHDFTYPAWADGLGWCIVAFCVMWLPVIFAKKVLQRGGIQIIKDALKPDPGWGPAKRSDRLGNYASQNGNINAAFQEDKDMSLPTLATKYEH